MCIVPIFIFLAVALLDFYEIKFTDSKERIG
jgi:hypothetical protein